jgi:hypothetical protein
MFGCPRNRVNFTLTPRPLPPGTWPKASDEGYFKNLISGGRKHSCECKRPLDCYTRPPNSTLSLPFPGMTNTLYTIGPLIIRPPNSTLSLPFLGMTNTLYTIGPLIKVSERGKTLALRDLEGEGTHYTVLPFSTPSAIPLAKTP